MGKNKNKNKNKNIVNLDEEEEANINNNESSELFEPIHSKKKNVFELLNDNLDVNPDVNLDVNPDVNSDVNLDINIIKGTDKYNILAIDADDYNRFDEAKELYLKSIQYDDDISKGISAHNLALLYEDKFDDEASAEKYYKMASNYSYNNSNYNLGIKYFNKNYKTSYEWFKKYINNGGCDAFYEYAKCCNEIGNYSEGFKYLSYHLMLKNSTIREKKLFKHLFFKNNS
jgi:hypothetical protein